MRRLLLFLVACRNPQAPADESAWEVPAAPPGEMKWVEPAELAADGFQLTALSSGETLACKGSACVCLTPLKSTITIQQNLRTFRAALESTGDRQVTCELAETGTCGAFTYFDFQGDIYRFEVRYFGSDGTIVGKRNTTDYDAYCEGRANVEIAGRIPSCPMRTATHHICGDPKRGSRGAPIDDLVK